MMKTPQKVEKVAVFLTKRILKSLQRSQTFTSDEYHPTPTPPASSPHFPLDAKLPERLSGLGEFLHFCFFFFFPPPPPLVFLLRGSSASCPGAAAVSVHDSHRRDEPREGRDEERRRGRPTGLGGCRPRWTPPSCQPRVTELPPGVGWSPSASRFGGGGGSWGGKLLGYRMEVGGGRRELSAPPCLV